MIDVALTPAEIRRWRDRDLSGHTTVVFDVLRATSTMITALANGVTSILPVEDLEEARQHKLADPELLLAGERGGLPLAGFDLGNSPAEFEKLAGNRCVMTTTNGTVALRHMAAAKRVYIGALLNLDELARVLLEENPAELLFVCAGTGEGFALEDGLAAGGLVARLAAGQTNSDAASLVLAAYQSLGSNIASCLLTSMNGAALCRIGKEADVRFCSRESVYPVVGELRDGLIVERLGRGTCESAV
ncbi:MAG: 2-phosphosulfolactate phosphatase [Verrucomicrobia bacterium]|nr:2-phosphosulfolactate phosphatase [Verrucomicrobiota bacterium]